VSLLTTGTRRGAAGVILGAILGSGLFIALLGIVVDAGVMFVDRQAQTLAAENTLSTVAKQCGSDPTQCETPGGILAVAQAAVPAGSRLVELCGPVAGGNVGPVSCQNLSLPLDCQPPSALYANSFLRVRVEATDSSTRTGILDALSFAASPDGPSGCAQAAFVAPNGARVPSPMPLALPACFSTDPGNEQVLVSIDPSLEGGSSGGVSCTVDTLDGPVTERSISGFTLVSLKEPSLSTYCVGDELVAVPVGIWVSREPNERTDLCGSAMSLAKASALIGTTQYFPVVGPPTSTGVGNYDFEIRTFRAFTITGFKLKVGSAGGKSTAFWESNGCEGNSFCVSGFFEEGTTDLLFPVDEATVGEIPDLDLAVTVEFY